MTRLTSQLALAVAVVCVTAVASLAKQTTTTSETKSFEVIAVDGNDLVVRLPEGTRELTVPDDFRFTVNGQPLSVQELTPGMKGTATITTRTTVFPVTVTEVKNGTVMQRSGSSIIVRTDQGIKMFSEGELDKRGVKLVKDGRPAQLSDFREGDRLSATIITSKPPKVMTEKEVQATTVPTAAPPKAAARAPSATATPSSSTTATPSSSTTATQSSSPTTGNSQTAAPGQPAKTLPKTASSWPFLALASVLSLAIGFALTIARRFVF
jgi:hypothetical protein